MQPIGAFGVVPQLVNQPVMMVPGRSSGKDLNGKGCCGGSKSKRKGSCSSCGRCFGSLLIILFAFICTSCCYAYPIYNSFTNPEYFKSQEEPIWTWKMALNKTKEFGYSMSLGKPQEDENRTYERSRQSDDFDKVQYLKLNNTENNGTGTTFINLENYLDKNSTKIAFPLYNNSYISNLLYSNAERKLSIRGGGGINLTKDVVIGLKTKKIPIKYFDKEYCERGNNGIVEGVWKELCNYKHNVTNFECIDMMNGPAICVGIRNRKYEVFSVSKQCKFVDPEIPVEIFPTISDLCYSDGINTKISTARFNITRPICPCMITSSPADHMELNSNTIVTGNQNTKELVLVNKTNAETQKTLRGSEVIISNPTNSSFNYFPAKSLNESTLGNNTSLMINMLNS